MENQPVKSSNTPLVIAIAVLIALALAATAVIIAFHHNAPSPAQQFNQCIQHAIANGTPVQYCPQP